MSIQRPFWLERIEAAWKRSPIVWLAGVRRSGKTTVAKLLSGSTYINCDLPSTKELLSEPEDFYRGVKTKIIIFDEIHQLHDPSQLLKIAADEFRNLRILATGSSTLIASKKFKDSLTGRKSVIHFVPVLCKELEAFGKNLEDRLLKGGSLRPSLLKT